MTRSTLYSRMPLEISISSIRRSAGSQVKGTRTSSDCTPGVAFRRRTRWSASSSAPPRWNGAALLTTRTFMRAPSCGQPLHDGAPVDLHLGQAVQRGVAHLGDGLLVGVQAVELLGQRPRVGLADQAV